MRVSSKQVRRLIHGIAFGADPAPGKGSPERNRFEDVRARHARWWSHRNVVGLCWARKTAHGAVGPPSLQVLVRRKLPRDRVPTPLRIPAEIDGRSLGLAGSVRTDVRAV